MKMNYLIQKSPNENIWLDGYNGGKEWEWTERKRNAWHFNFTEAHKRLAQVSKAFPSALIVNA